jgi:Fe-S cluster assembly protein SufD
VGSEILSATRLALTRESVQELWRRRREPEWLLALRLQAFEAFERLPMPDQRTEGWRRTSLRGLDLSQLDPLSGSVSVSISGDPRGVALPLEQALDNPHIAAKVQRYFGQIVAPESDKFAALHYAFFNAAVAVIVPRGAVLDEPIWIDYAAEGPALVHTLLVLEDDAELPALVEHYSGGAELASGAVEQVLGGNAHARYVQVQRLASDVWSFSWQRARLGQDASLRTLNATMGGRLARNNVQVVLEGRGAQADLLGVVGLGDRQHADFQTLQDHHGDATRSDLVIHDALRDRASANFTGLIRINKSAHQTESSQEQKNILLSDRSKADSDPKLEILNNDVIRCTHGAAVGPVDQEMVFYLESRGLDRATAEQLIVEGFFQSTLRKLECPAVEATVWDTLNRPR